MVEIGHQLGEGMGESDLLARSPARAIDEWLGKGPRATFAGPPLFDREADFERSARPDWCKHYRTLPLSDGVACTLFSDRKARLQEESRRDGDVKTKELYAEIAIGEAPATGSLTLVEWHIPLFIDNRDFYLQADEHSDDAAMAAGAVAANWSVADLAEAGGFVEFRHLWIAPGGPSAYWAEAVNQILASQKKFKPAILILKAHPLPFENSIELKQPAESDRHARYVEQLKRRHGSFVRRQVAMMRHYNKVLGVRPLPGELGLDGWMWKSLSALADMELEPSADLGGWTNTMDY